MAQLGANPVITELRERIAHLEGGLVRRNQVLPFGVHEIDEHLPGGGLSFGALHEFAGGGSGTVRRRGSRFVCRRDSRAYQGQGHLVPDEAGPLSGFGSGWPSARPRRLRRGDKEEDVLASMEETLSFGGLGAVGRTCPIADDSLPQAAAFRRKTGTMGPVVRRWRRQAEASDLGQPSASATRWRVSVVPSEELPVRGVARPRWFLELMRVKAGECAEFFVGACDVQGRIHLSAGVGDGSNTSQRPLYSR